MSDLAEEMSGYCPKLILDLYWAFMLLSSTSICTFRIWYLNLFAPCSGGVGWGDWGIYLLCLNHCDVWYYSRKSFSFENDYFYHDLLSMTVPLDLNGFHVDYQLTSDFYGREMRLFAEYKDGTRFSWYLHPYKFQF